MAGQDPPGPEKGEDGRGPRAMVIKKTRLMGGFRGFTAVELRRLELLTSCMPYKRSPN